MIKILFICHGNICRSTMAEYIFKDIVRKHNKERDFYIDSAATSREEIGNPVDIRTRKKLEEEGIYCGNHSARQVTKKDYDEFDYLFIMDSENAWGLKRIIQDDPENKIHKLLDFSANPTDIDDPWYTHDFNKCYDQILRACKDIYSYIEKRQASSYF